MLTAVADLDEAFTLGDHPAPFVVEIERQGAPLDLTGLSVTAALLPDSAIEADPTLTVAPGGGSITVQLPTLQRDGIRALQLMVAKTTAPAWSEAVAALPFIVDRQADVWHSIASAKAEWATTLSDTAVYRLLRIARQAVEAFAPAAMLVDSIEEDDRQALAQAQLAHARNLANAARANPASGDLDGDTYALSVRPLDWHVKQILRPAQGTPRVG